MRGKTSNLVRFEDDLLIICMAENQTGPELARLKEILTEHGTKLKGELNILVDVSDVRKSDDAANLAAKVFFKDLPFAKMAVHGGSALVNAGINLVLKLFMSPGVGEVQIFSSEEKARIWLKSSQ